MKKQLLFLLFTALSLLPLYAYDFVVDDICYNITSGNTCSVTYRDDSYNSYSGDVVIPESVTYNGTEYSVTTIGDYAFKDCSSLTSISIPNSVTEIGLYAFSDCSSLTSITIPNSVTSIGYAAFYCCIGLTSVEIPNSVTSIGEWVFYLCTGLSEITIPNSVTKIGDAAFYACKGLTSVTISNSVTEINDRTFYGCRGLTSVTIPNSVTKIGKMVFEECTELTEVTIGNSVTTIGDAAFSICNNLKSVIIPNSVIKIGSNAFSYCSGLTEVEISNSVTEIGASAFYHCSRLTEVEIPNSVTEIGICAFSGCIGLTSVEIGNSVTSIGDDAFSWCSSLTSVTIPNSVTKIGKYAFMNCSGLTSVTIGNSVKEIGSSAFADCNYQMKVAFPNAITWEYGGDQIIYDPETAEATADGCVYSKDGKSLLFVPTNLESFVIPEGVTTIGQNAFTACTLENLTIPSTIENVKADAFVNCKIERVNFTDWQKWYDNAKLENLTSNPYRDCGAYAGGLKVGVPELKDGIEKFPDYIHVGLTPYRNDIELPSSLKRIGAYAFYNNRELYSVIMPEGLEEIGESAFEGCELLENTELPSTLLSIEDNAFKGCSTLTEISLPESLTNLGNGVFANCSKLEKAVLLADIDALGNNLFTNCVALYKVYFPLQLKTIGNGTFVGCTALDEVTLPATLESIGEYAFAGDIENWWNSKRGTLSKLIIPNNVKTIGDNAFFRQNISNLTIGGGIETIPAYAFYYNNLKVINFSEGLKDIKENAFAGNAVIPSVQLPSSVTAIGENAFSGSNIKEFVVPDKVTDLPSGSCGTPSVLTIGSGVKTIAADAFGFDNLHVIRMKANTPPSLSDALNLSDAQNDALTMIVNNGSLSNYQKNARWKQIDNIIEESSSDVVIYMTGDYALSEEIRNTTGYMPSVVTKMKVIGPLTATDMRVIKENMISLQSLDLSEVTNITEIPYGQFEGSLLTEIKLPAVVKTIGNNAFANCLLLQISELPEGITSIGNNAFQNSPRVTVSKLPASLKSIGYSAFSGCTGIREITTGDALESISAPRYSWDGNGAFENCTMLETVDLSKSVLTVISNKTFSGCTSLDEVILPETVATIGENAFAGTAIRDITFAEKVAEIGKNAFSNCRRLVAANVPEKVNVVSTESFANCPRLIAATMPAGTNSVAANVFNGDSKLANISCAAVEAPAAEAGAFDGIRTRYVSLTVPVMSYRSYLNAPQWGKFQSIQNRIPVSIDNGVDVTNIAEEEFQDMVKEDQLEAAAEAAAQEQTEEPAGVARRRSARRAAARAVTYDGKQFASLFDGAQIQTGNDGKGTRIFVNPEDGVNVTSVKFNGEEMLSKLDGNTLLLPAGSNGSLEIKTDAAVSISDVELTGEEITGVYNLSGVKVGTSLNGLPKGVYIVRQGAKTTKLAI